MSGWLDEKGSKDFKASLGTAFRKIKEDLEMQRSIISDLSASQSALRKSTLLNQQRIAEWITHFESIINRLEVDSVSIESSLRNELENAAVQSGLRLQEAFEKQRLDYLAFKEDLKRELEVFMADSKLKAPIINVDNVNNVIPITPEPVNGLSNPEKWLMGVLFNAEAPLSYSQVAERTGKTVSTVRVYMNQLKFKGFVEESTLPNGLKIFSLKHEAKVKKLYNL
jgi:hypothetical protein